MRLEGFKGQDALLCPLTVTTGLGAVSRDDDALLETFLMDMSEGLIASVEGAARVPSARVWLWARSAQRPEVYGSPISVF